MTHDCSAIETSSTPSVTPSCRRSDSRAFGRTDVCCPGNRRHCRLAAEPTRLTQAVSKQTCYAFNARSQVVHFITRHPMELVLEPSANRQCPSKYGGPSSGVKIPRYSPWDRALRRPSRTSTDGSIGALTEIFPCPSRKPTGAVASGA
jgi:hypothetical protein